MTPHHSFRSRYMRIFPFFFCVTTMLDTHGVGSVTGVMISLLTIVSNSILTMLRSATGSLRGGFTMEIASGLNWILYSPGSSPRPSKVSTVNEHHKVVFEIDTGASCNILPFSDYIRATGDKQGIQIRPTRTTLTMHNNSKAVPKGKVMLFVERGGNSHYLHFLS